MIVGRGSRFAHQGVVLERASTVAVDNEILLETAAVIEMCHRDPFVDETPTAVGVPSHRVQVR